MMQQLGKRGTFLFLGGLSILALWWTATIPGSPCQMCFCGVRIVSLCPACPLTFGQELDCWICKNSSTCVPLEHDDRNTIEFLNFVLQKPIAWKNLSRGNAWCASCTTVPFLDCRRVSRYLCRSLRTVEKRLYPKGQCLFFSCTTRLKSFLSQPYTVHHLTSNPFETWSPAELMELHSTVLLVGTGHPER